MKRNSPCLAWTVVALLALIVAACGDRSSSEPSASAAADVSCVKVSGGAKASLYSKRGGEGDVRAELPAKIKLNVLRTLEGWSLVRVTGVQAMGWLPEKQVGQCKASEAKVADRGVVKARAKAPSAPAKSPAPAGGDAGVQRSGDAASSD